MNFNEWFFLNELFENSLAINWETPYTDAGGNWTYLGYFDVPVKRAQGWDNRDTIRFRMRAIMHDPRKHIDRIPNKQEINTVNFLKGPVAWLTFGRQNNQGSFVPNAPKESEALADEKLVFGTLIKGYREILAKTKPVAIIGMPQPDHKLETRISLYPKLFKIIARDLGYNSLGTPGYEMWIRKDIQHGI